MPQPGVGARQPSSGELSAALRGHLPQSGASCEPGLVEPRSWSRLRGLEGPRAMQCAAGQTARQASRGQWQPRGRAATCPRPMDRSGAWAPRPTCCAAPSLRLPLRPQTLRHTMAGPKPRLPCSAPSFAQPSADAPPPPSVAGAGERQAPSTLLNPHPLHHQRVLLSGDERLPRRLRF